MPLLKDEQPRAGEKVQSQAVVKANEPKEDFPESVHDTDRWSFVFALSIAAVALGQALQWNNGFYEPGALLLLTIAVAACGMAVAAPEFGKLAAVEPRHVRSILLLGLALQFAQLLMSPPGIALLNPDPTAR